MSKSTRKTRQGKGAASPGKPPIKNFPLQPHPTGMWQKRIRGKLYYFGRWGRTHKGKLERLPDPEWWQNGLAIYNANKEPLHAGTSTTVRKPDERPEGTLAELCNRFRTAKLRKKENGRITALTYESYRKTTDLLITEFGKDQLVADLEPKDFEGLLATMSERWGLVRLGNEITRAKSVFKYGHENIKGMSKALFGSEFKPPEQSELRKEKAKKGKRMLEADECRRMLGAADLQLRAMILLGINCGFNNKDCADLPLSTIKGEWIDFPRPKTGIERRCPLWPETVAALQAAIAERPEPRQNDAEGLVFITTRGRPFLSRGQANPVSVAAGKLMREVGVHRAGIGFATLRHVFRTVADGARDQVAINHVMGHADSSMGEVYRERIGDSRLVAVAQHVRAWLWPRSSEEKGV